MRKSLWTPDRREDPDHSYIKRPCYQDSELESYQAEKSCNMDEGLLGEVASWWETRKGSLMWYRILKALFFLILTTNMWWIYHLMDDSALDFALSLSTNPPSTIQLNDYPQCLHDDLDHFSTVECRRLREISLCANENTCLLIWNADKRKAQPPAAPHEMLEIFLPYVNHKPSAGISQVWFEQRTPSGVQGLTLECALSMSHSVAVTLGWDRSVCFSFIPRQTAAVTQRSSLQNRAWPRPTVSAAPLTQNNWARMRTWLSVSDHGQKNLNQPSN